jgi:hypothetical protein
MPRIIDEIFQVNRLNEKGFDAIDCVAGSFDLLLYNLENICDQNCREFSLVKTKLQEACFFAKRAVARNEDYQEKKK